MILFKRGVLVIVTGEDTDDLTNMTKSPWGIV